MRHVLLPTLLLLLFVPALAQDDETPRQSFERFIGAVMSDTVGDEERQRVFERYFDFDTWIEQRQETEGVTYTEVQRKELKSGWHDLFRSREFRKRYQDSGVKVTGEAVIDGDSAVLPIELAGQAFNVRMKASGQGWWRWYDIPAAEPKVDPEARITQIEQALQELAEQRARIARAEDALRHELRSLRSRLAEEGAGTTPYATPLSVVQTAWRAIESGEVTDLLECHTTARVAAADANGVQARMLKTRERLMDWEVLDSSIDIADAGRALVRVRLSLQRTGDPDERVISVPVVRVGEAWKIDQEP
jgi:hypothetical protein